MIRMFASLLTLFICLLSLPSVSGQHSGYRIEVQVKNFEGDTIRLGYYFGKSQYLKDTAVIENGKFLFQGDEALDPGLYLLVFPPDNSFAHILIADGQQDFTVSLDMNEIVNSSRFKGSEENDIYYNYLRQLEKRRPEAERLRGLVVSDSLHAEQHRADLAIIDKEVKDIQQSIVTKHPDSFTAMLIKASSEIDIPEFPDADETTRRQLQYEYYRAHYFDAFDLNDPRTIRSGLIQQKVDYFLQKLTYQVPDSQSVAMDYLLGQMDENPEAFQYYLVEFLNESARSKRMGMDAVYVHLVDHYYSTGKATWMDEEQLSKLVKQAETLRPTLIGKTAPNLTFYKASGETVTISDIKADYTVLFFWAPDCGHCKKAIPSIIDFYNTYKNRGVELLAICTKTGADLSTCWETIEERGMDIWVNVADQYLRSRYKTIYDIKTTPQIFILDKDKKILVKKIAGEDLAPVMEELMNLGKEK